MAINVLRGPSGYAALSPGSGVSASAAVVGTHPIASAPGSGFVSLTVVLRDLNRFEHWVAGVRNQETVALAPVLAHSEDAMLSSQDTASVVSRRVLGDDVKSAVKVLGVEQRSPAAVAGLRPGDVLVGARFAGRDVSFGSVEDVVGFLETVPAGGVVRMAVARGDTTLDVELARTEAERIGIRIGVAAPAGGVSFSVEGVSGSSAGLALTLAAIDAQSPGDLSAGLLVAASGEIALDGAVLPVGGVAQKLRSGPAREADVVFLPRLQGPEARGSKVVLVGSAQEAVAYLCAHGATDDVCHLMKR
jgi:PDZ domain-containing protein